MTEIFDSVNLINFLYAIILILAGFAIAKFASKWVDKLISKRGSAQLAMLVRRLIYYTIVIIFIASALQHLGFKLGVLLGTAGVASVAIGFASRTSMSNAVSGLFLLIEKPFVVGDTIIVNGTRGKVKTIDLMSTKIVTLENILVRIPNDKLVQSEIQNITHFKTRRIDLIIGVAYGTSIDKVREVLLNIAEQSKLCINKSETKVIVYSFADSAINLRLTVWCKTSDFAATKAELQETINNCFATENIEIPFPQITVHQANS